MKTFREIFPNRGREGMAVWGRHIVQFKRLVAQLTGEDEEADTERITPADEGEARYYLETMLKVAGLIAGQISAVHMKLETVIQAFLDGRMRAWSSTTLYDLIRHIAGATTPGAMTPPSQVTAELAKPVIIRMTAAFLIMEQEPPEDYVLPKIE